MKPGDVVEVEIEGLGLLRNPVVQGQCVTGYGTSFKYHSLWVTVARFSR